MSAKQVEATCTRTQSGLHCCSMAAVKEKGAAVAVAASGLSSAYRTEGLWADVNVVGIAAAPALVGVCVGVLAGACICDLDNDGPAWGTGGGRRDMYRLMLYRQEHGG